MPNQPTPTPTPKTNKPPKHSNTFHGFMDKKKPLQKVYKKKNECGV